MSWLGLPRVSAADVTVGQQMTEAVKPQVMWSDKPQPLALWRCILVAPAVLGRPRVEGHMTHSLWLYSTPAGPLLALAHAGASTRTHLRIGA
eukprot:scaffold32255_cov61-Phaeocystis_antarctica.AAC.2